MYVENKSKFIKINEFSYITKQQKFTYIYDLKPLTKLIGAKIDDLIVEYIGAHEIRYVNDHYFNIENVENIDVSIYSRYSSYLLKIITLPSIKYIATILNTGIIEYIKFTDRKQYAHHVYEIIDRFTIHKKASIKVLSPDFEDILLK